MEEVSFVMVGQNLLIKKKEREGKGKNEFKWGDCAKSATRRNFKI